MLAMNVTMSALEVRWRATLKRRVLPGKKSELGRINALHETRFSLEAFGDDRQPVMMGIKMTQGTIDHMLVVLMNAGVL